MSIAGERRAAVGRGPNRGRAPYDGGMEPRPAPVRRPAAGLVRGPEKPEDVVPFLENVTRGRGIPRERLEEVGEHYFRVRRPVADQRPEPRLPRRDPRGPRAAPGSTCRSTGATATGTPTSPTRFAQMRDDGVTRAACFVTSRLLVVLRCRQYRENLAAAAADGRGRAAPGQAAALLQPPGLRGADRRRHARGAGRAARRRPRRRAPGLRDPLDPDRDERAQRPLAAGPTSASTAASSPRSPSGSGRRPAVGTRSDLVYCSRSGPPQSPWLEPDVNDHLETLARRGRPAVVIVPIGFVSDHMEVVYDLDTEALAHGRAARPAGRPGRRRPGSTRASWRWSATCSWSGPPPSGASSSPGRTSAA